METLTVVAGIAQHQGRFLIFKRAAHKENAGFWEFPGGKVNSGESPQQGLEREIFEELGVKCKAGEILGTSHAQIGEKIIHLIGVAMSLESEPSSFKDHSEMKWVAWAELSTYPLTLPDLALLSFLRRKTDKE